MLADGFKDPKVAGVLATAALATGVSTILQASPSLVHELPRCDLPAVQIYVAEGLSAADVSEAILCPGNHLKELACDSTQAGGAAVQSLRKAGQSAQRSADTAR